MRGNGADLGGYAPASVRQPLVPQTERKELSVPGDYPSIQEAIDALAPGGTITVAPGTYEVGLTIWKPLTLHGAGKEKTVLKPLPNPTRRLIVSIIAGAKVTLEGLAVTESGGDGLLLYGEASLKGLQILGNGWDGILMEDSSQATISGSKISGNGYNGIRMEDSSQATILANKIFENEGYGVVLYQRPCYDIYENFEGKVKGSRNEIHDNGKGDVCPEELEFLKSEKGGCYGPKCD